MYLYQSPRYLVAILTPLELQLLFLTPSLVTSLPSPSPPPCSSYILHTDCFSSLDSRSNHLLISSSSCRFCSHLSLSSLFGLPHLLSDLSDLITGQITFLHLRIALLAGQLRRRWRRIISKACRISSSAHDVF